MAFWDFIKAIRKDEDEEEKRRQSGAGGRVFDFLDDTLDAGGRAGRWGLERGKDVAGIAAGAAREMAVKPLVTLSQTLQPNDDRLKRIDDLLSLPAEERERILNDPDDPRNASLTVYRSKLGDLSDERLKERREEVTREQEEKRKGFVPETRTEKMIFGNEPIQSYTERAKGLRSDWSDELGPLAAPAAALGTTANVALDLPGGSFVKTGVRALAREGTEEGVRRLLKKGLPNLSDEMLDRIIPTITKSTDEKEIAETLDTTLRAGRETTQQGAEAAMGLSSVTPLQRQMDDFSGRVRERAFREGEEVRPATDLAGAVIPKPNTLINTKVVGGDTPTRDKLLGQFKYTSEVEDKNKRSFGDRFYEQFFDKLSPINKMVKDIEQNTGRKLATEDNPYELARLYSGLPGSIRQRVETITDLLKEAPDIDDVKALGVARQVMRDRQGVSSLISSEEAQQVTREIYRKHGEEGFRRLTETVDQVIDYNRGLLDEIHDSGLISDDAYKAINENKDSYFARFNVIDHVLKDENKNIFGKGGSYNMARQNLVRKLKGMSEGTEILDPVESVVRSTDMAMRAMAKNNIWHSMKRLADEGTDWVKIIRDPEDVTKRIDLYGEAAEMRPVRNKLDRLIKSRGKTAGRLQREIDRLEKQGLDTSLKTGGTQPMPAFSPGGMGGKVPTSQAGGAAPNKLGPRDTQAFLRSLVESPNSRIQQLKKMVGNRDVKLTALLDDISGLRDEYESVATGIRKNVDEARALADADIPDGYELISGFGEGVGGRLAVPKEVADTYKGMTRSQADLATSLMAKTNQVMKDAVTSLSLPFAFVRNPSRDFKTMAANSRNIDNNIVKVIGAWVGGLASAWRKDEAYKRWIKAGGGGAGIYSRLDKAEDVAKQVTREIRGVQINSPKDLFSEAARILGTPFRAIQKAGSTLEAAPRLAEFKAGVSKGKSDVAAAFDARNVTVDFSQSGSVGQVMNQWVPFLNARVQGNKKMLEAAKNDPARFASMYTAMTAIPLATTYFYNQAKHPDVMAQIPQHVKDTNFLIILGDEKDSEGNFTQVVKIPKGDMDKVFGNPLENFLAYMNKDDPKGFTQVALESLSALSPVDFEKDGELSAGRALSGVLPVVIKAPVEQVANKNLYFDTPIVPESLARLPDEEQRRTDDAGQDTTSPVDSFISSLFGASPLRTKALRETTTGQLLSKNPAEALGSAVGGAGDSAPATEFYRTKKRADKQRASASKEINELVGQGNYAEALVRANKYNADLREQFAPWNEKYGQYADEDMQRVYDELKINLDKSSLKQRLTGVNKKKASQEAARNR